MQSNIFSTMEVIYRILSGIFTQEQENLNVFELDLHIVTVIRTKPVTLHRSLLDKSIDTKYAVVSQNTKEKNMS